MRSLLFLALMALVMGCQAGSFRVGTDYGMCIQGQVSSGEFAGSACPTVFPDGFHPLVARRMSPDGTVLGEYIPSTTVLSDGSTGTGHAAIILADSKRLEALFRVCALMDDKTPCAEALAR